MFIAACFSICELEKCEDMKQRVIMMSVLLCVLLSPVNVLAQSDRTKCPPSRSFYKNDGEKRPFIKLPKLPQVNVKIPKIPKFKKPDFSWVKAPNIKLPKLKPGKPRIPKMDIFKSEGKQVASTKCPK